MKQDHIWTTNVYPDPRSSGTRGTLEVLQSGRSGILYYRIHCYAPQFLRALVLPQIGHVTHDLFHQLKNVRELNLIGFYYVDARSPDGSDTANCVGIPHWFIVLALTFWAANLLLRKKPIGNKASPALAESREKSLVGPTRTTSGTEVCIPKALELLRECQFVRITDR